MERQQKLGHSESGHGWYETTGSYFFPEDRPPVEEEDYDEDDDDEEGQLEEEAETVVVEAGDCAEVSTPEEEFTPTEERTDDAAELGEGEAPVDSSSSGGGHRYDGSKCYHSKGAADQQIGKRVAHRYNDGVIYMGEVVKTLFRPATLEDPAHFINEVKFDADVKKDEVWKSRLLKDNRLHFHITMTYGRFAHDSLAAPPVYSSAYGKYVNDNLAWTNAGDHLSERPVMVVEPPPVAVGGN